MTRPGGPISATYDDQDRLLTYGPTTFTYTANGELSSRTTSGETTGYDYDALGNLDSVDLPDGTQIAYIVDGNNRRVGRKVDGILTQSWLYQDDLKPIAELDGSGNIVTRFIYATHENVPDYMIKGGETYRIVTDHLGSVRLVVDADTGQVAERMDYDAFGRVLRDTNPGFQPFGYAGGMYDPATGLVRFGVRDYDAGTGRWTAKDPIGFEGKDTNLYAYSGNDPINLMDPTGLKWGWKETVQAIGIIWGLAEPQDADRPTGTGEATGVRHEEVHKPDDESDDKSVKPCGPERRIMIAVSAATASWGTKSTDSTWKVIFTVTAVGATAIAVDILFPPAALRHLAGVP